MTADGFKEFLVQKLEIAAPQVPPAGSFSGTGNTIGALAMRLNVLSLDQIDAVLDRQEHDKQLFGQIAIQLGFATEEQVDRLIEIQRLHQCLEVGELLFLRGGTDLPALLNCLGEYVRSTK